MRLPAAPSPPPTSPTVRRRVHPDWVHRCSPPWPNFSKALEDFEGFLSAHRPATLERARLRPPASRDTRALVARELGLSSLPADVDSWLSWHDEQESDEPLFLEEADIDSWNMPHPIEGTPYTFRRMIDYPPTRVRFGYAPWRLLA